MSLSQPFWGVDPITSISQTTAATTHFMKTYRSLLINLSVSALILTCMGQGAAAAAPNPIRVLLITGGCCHDYAHQKDILKKGITERANVVIEQIHTDDTSTHPPLAILGNPDYAKGFDLVIHDECAAEVSDQAKVEGVLKPHRDGIPGVNLHCAMHSDRIRNPD